MCVSLISHPDSIIYSNEHPELLQAMAEGRFHNLESLITRRVGLEDFLEKGIKALLNEKDEHGELGSSFRLHGHLLTRQ